MRIETKFDLGDVVEIDAALVDKTRSSFNMNVIVTGIAVFEKGVEYRVAWFAHGKSETEWFSESRVTRMRD